MVSKILIIEDNSDINEILQGLLREEHEVFPAFSGTEGLMVFRYEAIDLVLLDIMLPGKSGDQVLAEIRQTSSVPVIIITALGDKKTVSDYLMNGANDYITKPFDLDEVHARVMVQLRNRSAVEPEKSKLTYKNIRLDADSFTINSAENSLRLGKKEFDILKTLMSRPKQIFTKEQLYEQVWQESYLPGDNTLNTHLSNLRKKINQLDSENEYIETIWSVGVKLAGDQ
ncbi:hypothetical protein IGI42_001380 [Enterococcus sp. AZ109]